MMVVGGIKEVLVYVTNKLRNEHSLFELTNQDIFDYTQRYLDQNDSIFDNYTITDIKRGCNSKGCNNVSIYLDIQVIGQGTTSHEIIIGYMGSWIYNSNKCIWSDYWTFQSNIDMSVKQITKGLWSKFQWELLSLDTFRLIKEEILSWFVFLPPFQKSEVKFIPISGGGAVFSFENYWITFNSSGDLLAYRRNQDNKPSCIMAIRADKLTV